VKRYHVPLIAAVLTLAVAVAACAPDTAAPPPAQTPAPAPAAPTPAPAAATPAPAAPAATPAAPGPAATPPAATQPAPARPAGAFPEAGRPITIIVPFGAGGSTDLATRIMAPHLERELGTTIQIVNRPGATTQVALSELATARPDGYTLGMFAIPSSIVTYLEPERGAPYTPESFAPIAIGFADGLGILVRTESPFQSLDDVVEAARANPGSISVSTAGLKGINHLGGLAWQEEAGVEFAFVHFNSGAEAITAALGGHVDVATATLGNVRPHVQNQVVRVLGVMEEERSPLLPDAPTMAEQGYDVFASAGYIVTAPRDTPTEVINTVAAAVERVVAIPDYERRINEIGMQAVYMDAEEAREYWADREEWVRELLPLAR
jgi:tripartite-type tricarboxylate transporter receptor subunit TctC